MEFPWIQQNMMASLLGLVFMRLFANALLTWRNRRDELVKGIHLIASGVEGMSHLQDKSIMGEIFPLKRHLSVYYYGLVQS